MILAAALALAPPLVGCPSSPHDDDDGPGAGDELCDGLDNDGDGAIDEGFPCARGATEPCALADSSCVGERVCDDRCSWTPCLSDSWECGQPGTTEACASQAGCPGERLCQTDCRWSACDDPAWDCDTPGAIAPCAAGLCDGLATCGDDCTLGACEPDCGAGEACCPDAGCVDLDHDPGHCGACDRACDDGECWSGTCCIEGCRNGSEVCDDQYFSVPSPYVAMKLVCRSDNGGVGYVATNTGPPMDDGVPRCQGWEQSGQDAWDHLDYIATIDCTATGMYADIDLSAWSGQGLYMGAHDQPTGGGGMTDVCIGEGAP